MLILIYHLLILNFLISLLSLIIIRLYSLSIHSWKQYNNSKDSSQTNENEP